jgi:predicted secreted protein
MLERKSFYLIIAALVLGGIHLWAGDNATFVDLGFSPDGRVYMFGQYGVVSGTLRPWADLGVVDVPRNNFVPGGRVSFVHTSPAALGQDGSGALYHQIAQNITLINRHGINFLLQGRPLYISPEPINGPGRGGEVVEFRDFDTGASYRASLIPSFEGSGENLKSSFIINLEKTDRNGVKQNYTVGSPQVKRSLITSYRIRKVTIAPQDGSMILVIEMQKPGEGGFDIRYMVEALQF